MILNVISQILNCSDKLIKIENAIYRFNFSLYVTF